MSSEEKNMPNSISYILVFHSEIKKYDVIIKKDSSSNIEIVFYDVSELEESKVTKIVEEE